MIFHPRTRRTVADQECQLSPPQSSSVLYMVVFYLALSDCCPIPSLRDLSSRSRTSEGIRQDWAELPTGLPYPGWKAGLSPGHLSQALLGPLGSSMREDEDRARAGLPRYGREDYLDPGTPAYHTTPGTPTPPAPSPAVRQHYPPVQQE